MMVSVLVITTHMINIAHVAIIAKRIIVAAVSINFRKMKIVTKSQLDEIRATDQLVVVDFFAEWCGPCKVFANTLEKLDGMYPDVTFVKVDTEEEDDLVDEFGIRNLPTLIILKGDDVLERKSGNLPATEVSELIIKHNN